VAECRKPPAERVAPPPEGVEVKKGMTTAHVKIQIEKGAVVTASITNEAVEDLQLKVGDQAAAVIKASEVIVGK
jgi:molybdopterin-binding protein